MRTRRKAENGRDFSAFLHPRKIIIIIMLAPEMCAILLLKLIFVDAGSPCAYHRASLYILKIIISVCTCVIQANKIRMDRFLIRRRVETPAETSSESSTSQPRTSGSCASTEGTSDEYCDRDSEAAASAIFQTGNTKKRKYGDCRRTFHKDWELDYLVTYESKSDTCICLKCNSTFDTVKKYTLQRHNEKMHPETVIWSKEKRKLFVEQKRKERQQMQNCLSGVCVSSKLPKLASYKLGFTLTQHHKPLSFGEPIIDWAQSCDPDSKIFKEIPRSRQTLTRRVIDLAAFIQDENRSHIITSAAWGIQMDESTDKSGHAQDVLIPNS